MHSFYRWQRPSGLNARTYRFPHLFSSSTCCWKTKTPVYQQSDWSCISRCDIDQESPGLHDFFVSETWHWNNEQPKLRLMLDLDHLRLHFHTPRLIRLVWNTSVAVFLLYWLARPVGSWHHNVDERPHWCPGPFCSPSEGLLSSGWLWHPAQNWKSYVLLQWKECKPSEFVDIPMFSLCS